MDFLEWLADELRNTEDEELEIGELETVDNMGDV